MQIDETRIEMEWRLVEALGALALPHCLCSWVGADWKWYEMVIYRNPVTGDLGTDLVENFHDAELRAWLRSHVPHDLTRDQCTPVRLTVTVDNAYDHYIDEDDPML